MAIRAPWCSPHACFCASTRTGHRIRAAGAVRSTRGALPMFPPVGFPEPPPAPAVPVSEQRALHKPRYGFVWFLIPRPATESGSLFPGIGTGWYASSPG